MTRSSYQKYIDITDLVAPSKNAIFAHGLECLGVERALKERFEVLSAMHSSEKLVSICKCPTLDSTLILARSPLQSCAPRECQVRCKLNLFDFNCLCEHYKTTPLGTLYFLKQEVQKKRNPLRRAFYANNNCRHLPPKPLLLHHSISGLFHFSLYGRLPL